MCACAFLGFRWQYTITKYYLKTLSLMAKLKRGLVVVKMPTSSLHKSGPCFLDLLKGYKQRLKMFAGFEVAIATAKVGLPCS